MSENSFPELIDRARLASSAGDGLQAAFLFHKAAVAALQSGLPNERAYALRHCAQAEIGNANFSKALCDASEALDFYLGRAQEDSLNTANTLRLVALAQEGLGDTDEAGRNWHRARELYHEHGIKAGVLECEEHLRGLN